MRLNFKNNFLGYFRFYHSVVGNAMFLFLFLSMLVSLLDGFGLAMFIPLLQAVGSNNSDPEIAKQSLGQLGFLIEGMQSIGITFNLFSVLGILVFMFVCKGVLKYIQGVYQSNIRFRFITKIRYLLVDNLNGLSYSGFLKMDAGRIQNTLIAEVQRLFLTLNHYFAAAQYAAMVVTYIVLAIMANWQFALLVTMGGGFSNFIFKGIYKATKRASLTVSIKGHDFNSYLIQAIQNFKYLKSTNYFNKFSLKLKRVIDDTERQNRKMGVYTAIINGIREPIIVVIVVIVIAIQINWIGGDLASIILSLLLFYRGLAFMMSVQQYWQNFIQNIGSIEVVTNLTREISAMQEQTSLLKFSTFYHNLHIKNIVFGYNENFTILNNINLTIPKNRTVAFVGESGSGKTTLANMVAGLIIPTSGTLEVDGKDLFLYDLNTFRDKIGYISQEAVIFNDNIYNNITFWAEKTPENLEKFLKAVEMASLNEFIKMQPDAENTILGDSGLLISGGQKQRISIARELYKDIEILILDEATSALDSETEKIIQQNIEALHGKFTMIIIAHRLSTIKNADMIYLLEKGTVAASGNFEEMKQGSERFKRMVALQEF